MQTLDRPSCLDAAFLRASCGRCPSCCFPQAIPQNQRRPSRPLGCQQEGQKLGRRVECRDCGRVLRVRDTGTPKGQQKGIHSSNPQPNTSKKKKTKQTNKPTNQTNKQQKQKPKPKTQKPLILTCPSRHRSRRAWLGGEGRQAGCAARR